MAGRRGSPSRSPSSSGRRSSRRRGDSRYSVEKVFDLSGTHYTKPKRSSSSWDDPSQNSHGDSESRKPQLQLFDSRENMAVTSVFPFKESHVIQPKAGACMHTSANDRSLGSSRDSAKDQHCQVILASPHLDPSAEGSSSCGVRSVGTLP
jgi:hypothetical protein